MFNVAYNASAFSSGNTAHRSRCLRPEPAPNPHSSHHPGAAASPGLNPSLRAQSVTSAMSPASRGRIEKPEARSHGQAAGLGRQLALPAALAASIRAKKSRPQRAGSTLLMVSQLPRLGGASVISAGTAPERTWSAPRQAWRPAQRRIAPLCRSPLKPPHLPVH